MKQTVTHLSQFFEAFKRCGRGEQFSYEALGLIYDYIEEYEQSIGEETELDVIAICCEWSENTPEEIAEMYRIDIEPHEEEDVSQAVLDYLYDETQVAGVTDSGSIVYVQF
jgi:hypothetical protein